MLEGGNLCAKMTKHAKIYKKLKNTASYTQSEAESGHSESASSFKTTHLFLYLI